METTIVYGGYIGIMESKMETTIVYGGYIGIMENGMETTVVYWGYIGIMENEMDTTIVCTPQTRSPEPETQSLHEFRLLRPGPRVNAGAMGYVAMASPNHLVYWKFPLSTQTVNLKQP